MIRIICQENGEQKDVTDKVIVGHAQVIELKEDNMEDKNKTVAELIAELQNQLNRANNRIEGLVKKNDELKEKNNTQFKNLLKKNDEAMKLIESLQKQLIQKENERAELYDELKYDENLLENANMNYIIDNVKPFIDTYEMLKNDYLKGYITEDDFFDDMDLNVNRMKKLLKQEELSNAN